MTWWALLTCFPFRKQGKNKHVSCITTTFSSPLALLCVSYEWQNVTSWRRLWWLCHSMYLYLHPWWWLHDLLWWVFCMATCGMYEGIENRGYYHFLYATMDHTLWITTRVVKYWNREIQLNLSELIRFLYAVCYIGSVAQMIEYWIMEWSEGSWFKYWLDYLCCFSLFV